jgi:tRNA wybutosine-synthesizing protein 2
MSYSKSAPRRNLSVSKLKKELDGQVDLNLNGWEILGDLMIIEIGSAYSTSDKRLIAEKIIELHPKATTVINRTSIDSELREPRVEILAGRDTETTYKENGISYRIDPTKVMFSFGNKDERIRMSKIAPEGETVVDMFSCIGQFALPLAKYSCPEKVFAIEKNPRAFEYLKENIKLNKLINVEAILGDCREVCPKEVADRVIMGYLFNTERFLKTAVAALDKKGIIHYHFVSSPLKLNNAMAKIKDILKVSAQSFDVINKVRIKSYAPKMYHWVFDLSVAK